MRKLLALFVAVLFVGTAAAQSFDVPTLVKMYNQNVNQVPDYVKSVIGNENLHIVFTLNDGTTYQFAAITKNAMITEAEAWADADGDGNHDAWQARGIKPTMKLSSNEGVLRGIAASPDPLVAFRQEWGKGIKFEALDFASNIKLSIANIGLWFFGLFSPMPKAQPKHAVGAKCQNGGECVTGNCVESVAGSRDFRCSCEALRYVAQIPCPKTIYNIPHTTNKAVGEPCNDGGECTTGNCVAEHAGSQLMRCSCDPFKYDALSC